MATLPISPPGDVNEFHNRHLRTCAHCGSREIYRQRPRGIIERHVYRAFSYAPYWCADCDSRFYLRILKDPPAQAAV
jgi:DNA-directed RNA polymerase subunit RPC12/RpoP